MWYSNLYFYTNSPPAPDGASPSLYQSRVGNGRLADVGVSAKNTTINCSCYLYENLKAKN